jgi:Tol biopolymer transport system component
MKTKRIILVSFVVAMCLGLSACGKGQLFDPTMTQTPLPPTLTPFPTFTPTTTPTPTPTPNPLSQVELTKIALKLGDLSVMGNIVHTESTKPADYISSAGTLPASEEPGVVNFYSENFNWSDGINSIIYVARVFENEALLTQYYQNDTRSIDPKDQFSIPLLGDKDVALIKSASNLNIVMIAWRYNVTYSFLMYSSQTSTRSNMMEEASSLAQLIDARLKKSILNQPDPNYASTLVGGGHGQIVFSSNRNGMMSDIYLMNSDGTQAVRLTHNSASNGTPSCSPDGKYIAYSSWDSGLYVMNADGTNPSLIAKDGSESSWSPDGTQIVYDDRNDNPQKSNIYIIKADGTNPRKLTEGVSPSWSPDGNYIVFSRYPYSTSEISILYRIKPDGTDLIQLTKNKLYYVSPSWSPDGRSIIFTDLHDIYLMNPDGSNWVNLTNGTFSGYLSQAIWSKDGSHIVFSSEQIIYIMDADGSNINRLSDFDARDNFPVWRP